MSLVLGIVGCVLISLGLAHIFHERPEPPDPNMFGALDPVPAAIYPLSMYRHRREHLHANTPSNGVRQSRLGGSDDSPGDRSGFPFPAGPKGAA